MKTDALVRALAADTAPGPAPRTLLWRGLLVGAILVAAIALPILGLRPDPMAALTTARVTVKQLFPLLLAIGGFGGALALARPEGRVGGWWAVIAVVPALLAVAVVSELAALPRTGWMPAMMGESHRFCLVWATVMAMPPLAGALWALRSGASTRPGLSGALAGLLAGGTAVSIYAMHCTEDSPLFYSVWYVLAILIATALGAVIGRRLLRW